MIPIQRSGWGPFAQILPFAEEGNLITSGSVNLTVSGSSTAIRIGWTQCPSYASTINAQDSHYGPNLGTSSTLGDASSPWATAGAPWRGRGFSSFNTRGTSKVVLVAESARSRTYAVAPIVWATTTGRTVPVGTGTAGAASDHTGGLRGLLTADGAVRFLSDVEDVQASSNPTLYVTIN